MDIRIYVEPETVPEPDAFRGQNYRFARSGPSELLVHVEVDGATLSSTSAEGWRRLARLAGRIADTIAQHDELESVARGEAADAADRVDVEVSA